MATYTGTLEDGRKFSFEHDSPNLTQDQVGQIVNEQVGNFSSTQGFTPDFSQVKNPPGIFSGSIAKMAFPTAGTLLAHAALMGIAPEAEIPLLASMGLTGLAAGGSELARQSVANEQPNPLQALKTGAGFATFGPLAEGIGGPLSKFVGMGARPILRAGVKVATAGGIVGAGEGALEPAPDLIGRLRNVLTGGASGVLAGGVGGMAIEGGGRFINALRGYPKEVASLKSNLNDQLGRIEQTKQELEQALPDEAYKVQQSLRRGGELNQTVMKFLHDEGEKAWAPMKDLSAQIKNPIPGEQIESSIQNRFGDDPNRMAQVQQVFKDAVKKLPGTKEVGGVPLNEFIEKRQMSPELAKAIGVGTPGHYSAQDLIDISSKLGQKIPQGQAFSPQARSLADARMIISDILEANAPEDLKGAVSLAKQNWAKYATDRDEIFSLFKPVSQQNEPPSPLGIKFLQDVASGKPSQYQKDFLSRLEAGLGGKNLTGSMQPMNQELQSLPMAQEAEQGLVAPQLKALAQKTNLARRAALVGIGYPLIRALTAPLRSAVRQKR